jgi:PAS domain-containing protein
MTTKQDRIDALRRAAEDELARATPPAPEATPEALLHELQIHQIELEMQNKALQTAQISLESARDRYASLFNFAPVAYLSLSPHGIVVEANLAADKLLCRPLAKLLRRPFEDFVAKAEHDRWREHFREIWRTDPNRTHDLELLMHNTSGTNALAQLQCMVVDGPDGKRTMRIALFDITGRHQD